MLIRRCQIDRVTHLEQRAYLFAVARQRAIRRGFQFVHGPVKEQQIPVFAQRMHVLGLQHGAAAGRKHNTALLGQFRNDFGFDGAERGLAVGRKVVRDRHTDALGDHLVAVVKRPVQQFRKPRAHARLADAGHPDQH